MWQIHATYIKINQVKPIIRVLLFVQLMLIIVWDYWLFVKILLMFF